MRNAGDRATDSATDSATGLGTNSNTTSGALCRGVLIYPQFLLLLVLLVLLAICVQVARGYAHATIQRNHALEE